MVKYIMNKNTSRRIYQTLLILIPIILIMITIIVGIIAVDNTKQALALCMNNSDCIIKALVS